MDYTEFERLLKESIGVDVASIGVSTLARAVRERQRACRCDDLAAYWRHLSGSNTELQALVEAVVVPETWFFRDRKAFAALGGLIREQCAGTGASRVVRMLSVPCSTGEEPYSMAMALIDEGVPLDRFHIDAVDVSARALAVAGRGVYGNRSFRGQSLDFRRRHFRETADGYLVGDTVRRQTAFKQGNLLSPTFHPGADVYDVIFCRNLLIYFDRATQGRAIRALWHLLRPSGWLFVGSSETALLRNHGFVSAQIPMAFAFRRADPQSPRLKPTAARPKRTLQRSVPVAASAAPVVIKPTHPVAVPFEPRRAPSTWLDEANDLANQGRLVDAAARCEQHLREHGPTAEAFHLLGLIHDTAGHEADAIACYRKALYLDPRHEHALTHLALLMEKLDKKGEADLLRTRARRLTRKGV